MDGESVKERYRSHNHGGLLTRFFHFVTKFKGGVKL